MSLQLVALVVVIGAALLFEYTNGFHDAATAIATSVSTRALTPRVALAMASVMNFIGALLGTGVAKTVTKGIVQAPGGAHGLTVVFAAVLGAVAWNMITWYFGLPSSSTHALIGGLVGASLAASVPVLWNGVADKVIVPMVISPIVGLILGYLVMVAILWLFRRSRPGRVNRGFRVAQTISAAAMGLAHGLQDAQKTMAIIVLALVATGSQHDAHVPLWVVAITAVAMAIGTYSGGWRIMRTLGRRVIELDPPKGFAAEVTASAVLYTTAFLWKVPTSSTHVITGAIMGVGSTKRISAVRWGVAGNIVGAWISRYRPQASPRPSSTRSPTPYWARERAEGRRASEQPNYPHAPGHEPAAVMPGSINRPHSETSASRSPRGRTSADREADIAASITQTSGPRRDARIRPGHWSARMRR